MKKLRVLGEAEFTDAPRYYGAPNEATVLASDLFVDRRAPQT
jgi:hypothetical protein